MVIAKCRRVGARVRDRMFGVVVTLIVLIEMRVPDLPTAEDSEAVDGDES